MSAVTTQIVVGFIVPSLDGGGCLTPAILLRRYE